MIEPPDAWGISIFCDDIRAEVGNKFSLIGVYSAGLTIHGTLPATLVKLAISIHYWERVGRFSGPTKLRIHLPQDTDELPSVEAELPIDNIAASFPDKEHSGFLKFSTNITLSPLMIVTSGRIKVRVVRNDEIIRLGTLKIDVAEPQVAPAQPPQS